MSETKKDVIRFKSSNGTDEVVGYYYTCPEVKPQYILQISHGMNEYIGRYDNFAAFMTQHGFVVCGNDDLGHGATSDGANGVDGYFGEKDGRQYVLQDLHRMNSLASKAYPGLPIILLGHSMGSFFARLYAATYPESIQGLIISGTGGPNPAGGVAIFLTSLLGKLHGQKYRSNFVNKLAFGSYLKKIENPRTPYDWLTHDNAIVDKYAQDPKCTYIFTVSGMREIALTLKAVSTPEWAQRLDKKTPVLVMSGEMDPVGEYGKGVKTVFGFLQEAGIQDATLKLYSGGRHEMLNETNKPEVWDDVLDWCTTHVKKS